MIRLPPSSTRTDTLFPYPTLFPSPQSQLALAVLAVAFNGLDADAERLGNDLIAFTGTDASEHLALTHTERQWRGFQRRPQWRSEEHTSELQSLMRTSYAGFCLQKKNMNTKSRTKSREQTPRC